MSVDASASVAQRRERRWSINGLVDALFFVFAGLMAVWLAWLVLSESFGHWQMIGYIIPFYVVLAYVALPRIHRILTNIYVPDYFIGRSRTDDGLLGDPINIALRGDQLQIEAAMQAAGWTRADEVTLASSWKIIISTLTRRSYKEAPVSNLKLFGRPQDFAYQQEVANSPAKRHHIRFWRCPDDWMLPGGHEVEWLAAGSFDRSVGLSLFTFQVTHKIDPHVDIERDFVVQSISDANQGVRVETIEDFSTGYHSRNGGGDQIQTDGDLPIVDLTNIDRLKEEDAPLHDLREASEPSAHEKLLGNPVVKADVKGTNVVVPTLERPLPTIFGALFAVFSAVTTVISAILFATGHQIDSELNGITDVADEHLIAEVVTGFVIVFNCAVALFQLILAIFVWMGRNWARITLMSVTAFTIVTTFFSVLRGHSRLVLSVDLLSTNLITVALQIFVVLALSSVKARAFARRERA